MNQRARLLAAIAELVARDGYGETTVAQVSKHARVSSATFYTLFENKEDCFTAAHRQLAAGLLGEVEQRVSASDPDLVWRATVEALFEFAARRPDTLRLLADEATMSVKRALEERDHMLSALEDLIDRARPGVAENRGEPDLPAKALLGGALRLLVLRLRDQDTDLQRLRDAIIQWSGSYSHPGSAPRWQSLSPAPGLTAGPPDYASGLAPPQRSSRGRNRLSAEEISRNQHERIIHATAEITAAQGYAATTVADIVATAGLAREVFYRHFRDKQDAFLQAYETGFQTLMALSIKSFYTVTNWPERIWAALLAYTDFMVNFASFASLGMVESTTLPRDVIGVTEERVMAFTVFLQESYRGESASVEQPEAVSEAIAMAIYEITAYLLRNDRGHELPGMTPLLSYISLAPFMGPAQATEFLQHRTAGREATLERRG